MVQNRHIKLGRNHFKMTLLSLRMIGGLKMKWGCDEMVDMLASKTGVERRESSSLSIPTRDYKNMGM